SRKNVIESVTKSTNENRDKFGEYYFRLSDYLYTAPRQLDFLRILQGLTAAKVVGCSGAMQ
ncbi:MAG: hypothetical protein IIW85_03585, partial [Bacteroidaceae bacterium]|nr:hypothetical protein [Bacteroidaceae bacterium]